MPACAHAGVCWQRTVMSTPTCTPLVNQGRACTAGMTDGKRMCNVRATEQMAEGVGMQVLRSSGRHAGPTGRQVGNAGTVNENGVK